MPVTLHDLLGPQRLTEVVDIGANPIDGDPPYKRMLQDGLCRVTGFEPQQDALDQLLSKKGPNERYLPQAIGDGSVAKLNVCSASGMTSLLVPDVSRLKAFGVLESAGTVIATQDIKTTRLDDVGIIEAIDFLKMDIQGSELSVLRNAREKLRGAVFVQTEVSFVELYRGQPGLGELDSDLREQGFIPHAFAEIKIWPISPFLMNNNPMAGLNQLLEADLVYCRDFTKP